MKKVYYSVTRYGKKNVDSMSGVGYITDEDLIIACSAKEQKPYIRVFEDCLKDCYPIAGKTNEFKGKYYEIREVELLQPNGSIDTRELTFNYSIWYKLAA